MVKTTREIIKDKLIALAEGIVFDVLIPSDSKLGDYSTNIAFVLAKKEKRKPAEVAEELKNKLTTDLADICDIQVAPSGYLNFFLKSEFLQDQLQEISKNENYGQSDEGQGKKVIVEYSSPNIAKPMHIGHLRSTIIGDSLANVYEKLGYSVIRWNFIGDWGTQFGKLIAAYKRWVNRKALEEGPSEEMLRLYVRFHEEMKNNPELEKEGQEEFKKLENDDEGNKEIWKLFRKESLEEFEDIYEQLGINIRNGELVIKGESDYESKLKDFIEDLIDKRIVKPSEEPESERALVAELQDLPDVLLRKSDDATLYITRDLVSLQDRVENYGSSKILYVVANQQALHFQQLFALAQKLGWTSSELVHVKFGMVLGEDGKKLATREGKVVALQEVIDKITELAHETVKQKNSSLSGEEMEKVAHVVAIGALKYNDLKQHPYSDIEFDWKAMLDLSGNSGPYIQYTYARLANILIKANLASYQLPVTNFQLLNEKSELRLMRQLLDYPEAIKECAERYALNGLALYLYDLAHLANQFYEQVHVLEDDNTARRDVRLLLIKTVSRTLKDGLALLGIETLERI